MGKTYDKHLLLFIIFASIILKIFILLYMNGLNIDKLQ